MRNKGAAVKKVHERMPRTMFDFAVLRELRRRSGLTIAGLSAATGVTPSVISKLERNRTAAELATLFSLARAFGMSATDLLMLAERRSAHCARERGRRAGSFRFREIHYGNIRALLGESRAGGRVANPEVHQDDFEVCWVLSGRVRIRLPHERHELKTGDCIQFDAILEHAYEVLEDCRILILHLRKGKRF